MSFRISCFPNCSYLKLNIRFQDAWASLQWKQWRMRRRLRRQMSSGDFWKMSWYRQLFFIIELPFVLVRNATIPPVEADSWSQLQAAVNTVFPFIFFVVVFFGFRLFSFCSISYMCVFFFMSILLFPISYPFPFPLFFFFFFSCHYSPI